MSFLIYCQLIIIVRKNDTSKNKKYIISTNIIVFESMEVQWHQYLLCQPACLRTSSVTKYSKHVELNDFKPIIIIINLLLSLTCC